MVVRSGSLSLGGFMRWMVIVVALVISSCGKPGFFEACDAQTCADGLVCRPNGVAGQPELCSKACQADADCPNTTGECKVPTKCTGGFCVLGDQRCL